MHMQIGMQIKLLVIIQSNRIALYSPLQLLYSLFVKTFIPTNDRLLLKPKLIRSVRENQNIT